MAKEIEKYKTQLISKQDMIIQLNQDLMGLKQTVESLTSQLIAREKDLEERNKKIQKLSNKELCFTDEINKLRDELDRYCKTATTPVVAKANTFKIDLNDSGSANEMTPTHRDCHLDNEVFRFKKSPTESKRKLQQYEKQLGYFENKLVKTQRNLAEKDSQIIRLREINEKLMKTFNSTSGEFNTF